MSKLGHCADLPGATAAFYEGFLQQMQPLVDDFGHVGRPGCATCGTPTSGALCAFCRLTAVASAAGFHAQRRRGVGTRTALGWTP